MPLSASSSGMALFPRHVSKRPRFESTTVFTPNKRDIHADASFIWWGKVDSNHRRHCQQIYSLSHLATLEFPHIQLRWSWWTDSNPRPADYKRWPERQSIDFRCFSQLLCRGFSSIHACCVHPVHTVMFPFGSRFGSNGSAAQLVDRFYQQISQRRVLKICAGINKEKAEYILHHFLLHCQNTLADPVED